MRTVNCIKLNQELEGLERPPYPGDFGIRIYNSVSKVAWKGWLDHQTMLLNENRLNMLDPEARKYLRDQCESFFFGGAVDQPASFVQIDLL